MSEFTLKDGRKTTEERIVAVMTQLEEIFQDRYGDRAAADLVKLAQNPGLVIRIESCEILRELKLIDGNTKIVSDEVRDIILAAAVGSGLDTNFISPLVHA